MFVIIELFELLGFTTKEIEEWHVLIKKNVEEFRQKSQKTNWMIAIKNKLNDRHSACALLILNLIEIW